MPAPLPDRKRSRKEKSQQRASLSSKQAAATNQWQQQASCSNKRVSKANKSQQQTVAETCFSLFLLRAGF
jgi:hypothetical protein